MTTATTVRSEPVGPAETAAAGFLDALRIDDLDTAASMVGPRTRAYAATTGRTVQDVLVTETGDLAPLVAATARTWSSVGGVPGVVVAVAGHGRDLAAIPVVEGDGGWLVEPAALGDSGSHVLLLHERVTIDKPLTFSVPVRGGLWMSWDGHLVKIRDEVRDGAGLVRWQLGIGGRHLVVSVLHSGDVLTASAWWVEIDPEPSSVLGAVHVVRNAWLGGQLDQVARYATAEPARRLRAEPNGDWYATGAPTCTTDTCTWTRADGRRLVLRAAKVNGGWRVVDARFLPTARR